MATSKTVATTDEKKGVASLDRDQARELSHTERMTNSELKNITSFEEAMKYVQETYQKSISVAENLGNGFTVLSKDEKDRLVSVPFMILGFTLNEGDFGDDGFCSLQVVTSDDRRFILNDGGAGIREQLFELLEGNPGRYGGYFVPRGLSVSEYSTCVGCGQPRRESVETCKNVLKNGSVCGDEDTKRGSGTTFYLDTSDSQ